MKAGIHQINYFPWFGYFNKIAKSDVFIFLDEVQLSDSGTMQRNRVLNKSGIPSFLTIAFNKKGYMGKKFNEIEINKQVDWQSRQLNFLKDTYHKLEYWNEVYLMIEPIFFNTFIRLQDVNVMSIEIIMKMLGINTPIIYQSKLSYNLNNKKNDLVLNLCKAVNADIYLSGNGARKYLDVCSFSKEGIGVQFQNYTHPYYKQFYAKEPVLGLSILDVLLNCGINNTRRLFWDNMQRNEVME